MKLTQKLSIGVSARQMFALVSLCFALLSLFARSERSVFRHSEAHPNKKHGNNEIKLEHKPAIKTKRVEQKKLDNLMYEIKCGRRVNDRMGKKILDNNSIVQSVQ